MPPKGQSEALSKRNKHNGAQWKGLSGTEKDVFSARIFFALAGLPNFELEEEETDEDEDETDPNEISGQLTPVESLTAEEEATYRPIYERLIDQDRVKTAYADGLDVSSAPTVVKKGLQSARAINNEVSA